LVQATLSIIEEVGADHVTVSEAAKRAGVSSGAPFRHFSSKSELMTAVAEVLQNDLLKAMQTAYDQNPGDPWKTLASLGLAYMGWGLEKPAYFRTYSNRNLYDFDSSPVLREGTAKLIWMVESTFACVLPDNSIRAERARRLNIHARALLTGLVTLSCYGLFPEFGVEAEDPMVTLRKSWQGFLNSVRLTIEARPSETGYYELLVD